MYLHTHSTNAVLCCPHASLALTVPRGGRNKAPQARGLPAAHVYSVTQVEAGGPTLRVTLALEAPGGESRLLRLLEAPTPLTAGRIPQPLPLPACASSSSVRLSSPPLPPHLSLVRTFVISLRVTLVILDGLPVLNVTSSHICRDPVFQRSSRSKIPNLGCTRNFTSPPLAGI